VEEGFAGCSVDVVNNEGKFWDISDSMTSGHDKGSNSRGSEGSGDGMSSLGDVDSSVPVSPYVEWSEHSSLSAHVTESGLSGS